MADLLLSIVTPQREAFQEAVSYVSVPTPQGLIGILPKHVPLVTVLVEGEIHIVQGKKDTYLAIGGGFMEVTKKEVMILVSRAVHADELNEEEIKKARLAVKDAVSRKDKTIERGEARAILHRSFIELKVLEHRKRYRQTPTLQK
jgi:F-type H+-transporting ATPase subunit epsilon